MRPALALAFLLCAAACKSAPETRPQLGRNATHPRSRVDESAAYVAALREEYDALSHVQSMLGWYAATQGETPIRKLTYIGHDRLFRKTALDAVGAAEQQPGLGKNEALALRFLRRSLTGEIVHLATAGFTDEFRDAEASATVSLPWRDKPVAYNDLSNLIAQEADAQRRAQAFAAMNAVRVQKLNPILERK